MEHHAAVDVGTSDFVALVVGLGVTARHTHDAHSGTRVELNLALVKVALGHTLEQVDNVALQAQHDGFGLGVAHAAVIFNNLGLAVAVDKTEEDKALVVDALGSKPVDGGAYNLVLNLLHPLFGGKRYG